MNLSTLSSRIEALEAQLSPKKAARFDLAKHSEGHPKQHRFSSSVAKYRTACCSRRAGKSEGAAGALLEPALNSPGCVALYITKTRVNAKRIIWGVLKRINRDFDLGGEPKEAELCLLFPNGSAVYLVGANNRDEIEKFRGLPIKVVVLDESQILLSYLKELVDEVLAPALMDYDGAIVLIGTPAPVPAGYFWECIQNPEWEHHHWTVFDNPWILKKSGKTPQQHLEAELKRRGVTIEDPTIQREWFGRWAFDSNALVFRYSADVNHFDVLPAPRVGEWETLVCGDLGFDDADALGVLKWHTTLPDLWLVEEHVLPKQTITQLGDKLRALVDSYKPLAVVLDTGALGKKIAAELTSRWGLKVEAAEKERKLEHIELLNDAMRTGLFHAKKDSRFAQDCMLVEWDRGNPEKPKISDRYHSDITDAVLYGYRRAKQWLFVPPVAPGPAVGTPEWHEAHFARETKAIEEQLERDMEESMRAKRERFEEQQEEEMLW